MMEDTKVKANSTTDKNVGCNNALAAIATLEVEMTAHTVGDNAH